MRCLEERMGKNCNRPAHMGHAPGRHPGGLQLYGVAARAQNNNLADIITICTELSARAFSNFGGQNPFQMAKLVE